MLTERRILQEILRGLEAIGETRFGSVVRGAKSVLRCINPIRQLVSEGAFIVPVSENVSELALASTNLASRGLVMRLL